jgi:SAM-dependent methyltransferase
MNFSIDLRLINLCPEEVSLIRYLQAKKSIDDRSLNAHVAQTLIMRLQELFDNIEVRVFEAGCGIGTMIERMLSWGALAKCSYTAIDLEPEHVAEAMRRLVQLGFRGEIQPQKGSDHTLVLKNRTQEIKIELKIGNVIKFARDKDNFHQYHLILAHAFLDLVDIYSFLPPILSCGIPGGLIYFTLNFDGATSLEPIIEADLDRQIIALYHETMDHRLIQGKPSGDSQTGRHLLPFLQKLGLNILDAGASDWVIFPHMGSYPNDDAYFLHFIIDTIYCALEFCPEIKPGQLKTWAEIRHEQIEHGELFYMAHQIDVLCQTHRPAVTNNES